MRTEVRRSFGKIRPGSAQLEIVGSPFIKEKDIVGIYLFVRNPSHHPDVVLGTGMGYDWSGARERRIKVARYSVALTLAALIIAVAFQIANRQL
ncbi:hypothetical protein [Sinorhizobium sp. Sb3]|uniref:hypothetical protein n=1 Tax=Sinorhizobium sp. Sb3 TaxID=1358417 RepID=UPI0012E3DAA2|nr:hypothetical protein [Sinorhizobium sp. Sb3]